MRVPLQGGKQLSRRFVNSFMLTNSKVYTGQGNSVINTGFCAPAVPAAARRPVEAPPARGCRLQAKCEVKRLQSAHGLRPILASGWLQRCCCLKPQRRSGLGQWQLPLPRRTGSATPAPKSTVRFSIKHYICPCRGSVRSPGWNCVSDAAQSEPAGVRTDVQL